MASAVITSTVLESSEASNGIQFRIVCAMCIYEVHDAPSIYEHRPWPGHQCAQNVLLAKADNNSCQWSRVRDRTFQRSFVTTLSPFTTASPPSRCIFNDMICYVAHNPLEQQLWNLEMDGEFHIFDIISKHRKLPAVDVFGKTGSYFMSKYGGELKIVCGICGFEPVAGGLSCGGPEGHNFSENKVLMHISLCELSQYCYLQIPSPISTTRLCKKLMHCRDNDCKKAHYFLERDFSVLIHKFRGIGMEELMDKLNHIKVTLVHELQRNCTMKVDVDNLTASGAVKVNESHEKRNSGDNSIDNGPIPKASESQTLHCPFQFIVVCAECWKIKSLIEEFNEKKISEKCGRSHLWAMNRAVLEITSRKVLIRALPVKRPNSVSKLSICKHINTKLSCVRPDCQFAHTEVEKNVWTWQLSSNPIVENLVDFAVAQQRNVESKNRRIQRIISGSNSRTIANGYPQRLPANYCTYCHKQCNGASQYKHHCSSNQHISTITTDLDIEWKYRVPPPGGDYEICTSNERGMCEYSDVHKDFNLCDKAHSEEELDEWRVRIKYRREKQKTAQNDKELPLMYLNSKFCDEISDVNVKCAEDLHVCLEKKNDTFTWKFHIEQSSGGVKLLRVALIFGPSFIHFSLSVGQDCQADGVAKSLAGQEPVDQQPTCQEPTSLEPTTQQQTGLEAAVDVARYLDESTFSSSNVDMIFVTFRAEMFGSFQQSVVFDFGPDKRLERKLFVDVSSSRQQYEEVQQLRQQLSITSWTEENSQIVGFSATGSDDVNTETSDYKLPSLDQVLTVDCQDENIELSEGNYLHVMHRLLYLEEWERKKLISKFAVTCTLEVCQKLQRDGLGLTIAPNGTFFGKILSEDISLSDGSDASQLILSSCSSVLLSPHLATPEYKNGKRKVYKASIIPDGKGKEMISVSLSAICVQELLLTDGRTIAIDVQLQLDRQTFVTMHEAIDAVKTSHNLWMLFPYSPACGVPFGHIPSSDLEKMNAKQRKVLEFMFENKSNLYQGLFPLIVYGPFGTGKTWTLAHSAKHLVKKKPKDSRILICTQSNSAADLYVTKYFNGICKNNSVDELKILRIYATERRLNTVPKDVQLYCCFSADKMSFTLPTKEVVLGNQIVITTLSMSKVLVELGLHGEFSHILLDEAGQALEAEAIMPLALAKQSTCIVVAGDHQQISPVVYSPHAREKNMHMSLLERLFLHYKKLNMLKMCTVLLHQNYRSSKEIAQFLSKAFYSNALEACRQDEALPVLCSGLQFHCVQGKEIQDEKNLSYFNPAEVDEIVQIVQDLMGSGVSWQQQEICVVSAYSAQIGLIRSALRQKKLGQVTVESISNVQGKEFRALLISTVITASSSAHKECKNLGFLSDPKLMNTAISRVMSYVAVVGDAVALCTLGSCRKLWLQYITECSDRRALFPADFSVAALTSQIQSADAAGNDTEDADELRPDDILQELARQTAEAVGLNTVLEGNVTIEIDDDEGYGMIRVSQAPMKLDVDSGREIVVSDPKAAQQLKERKLRELLVEDPNKFARCMLQFELQDGDVSARVKILGVVLENVKQVGGQHIEIPDLANCGQAFSMDEVVVEITERKENLLIGKVVDILKKVTDRERMQVVCMADLHMQGFMRPLDPTLPLFKSYIEKKSIEKAKKDGLIAVYSSNGKKFRHFVKVELGQSRKKLFLVKYLKWDSPFLYPLGIVINEMPLGLDYDSGLKILAINYQIRTEFPAKALAEVTEVVRHHYSLTGEICTKSVDYTDAFVFTIDTEKAEDLDDAISVELMDGKNLCLIGVHITDVSFFVKKDTCLDREAYHRNRTFYRDSYDDTLIPMFPHKLSTDLFSLLPYKERLVISFFFEVRCDTGEIVKECEPVRCRVKSCKQFTYEEVDSILSHADLLHQSEYSRELNILNRVTKQWSRGKCKFFNSHRMVTELMCKVKERTAKLLLEKFPTCVPLFIRNQAVDSAIAPVPTRSNEDHVLQFQNDDTSNSFFVLKPVWYSIMKAVSEKNFTEASQFLLDSMRHFPEYYDLLDWTEEDTNMKFICSGKVDCSTFDETDTRVTSPMRRYMDLVGQRLVAAVIDKEESPYTEDEIHELCEHSNSLMLRFNQFEQDIKILKYAVDLKHKTAVVFPLVQRFTYSHLFLKFPSYSRELHRLGYNAMDLVDVPDVSRALKLPWQQRIYDLAFIRNQQASRREAANANDEVLVPMPKDKYCYRIPKEQWKSLLEAAKFSEFIELSQKLFQIHNDFVVKQFHSRQLILWNPEVTSESYNARGQDFKEHFVKFKMALETGSLVQVQLTADVIDGLLQPTTQLLCLTPKLDVCIEHHEEPLKCFATEFVRVASQPKYSSVEEYQKAWLPVLSLQAAHTAVAEGGAIISGVRIRWTRDGDFICGRFQVEKDFCKHRQISFYPMNARYFAEDYKLLPNDKRQLLVGSEEFDLLCVRYTALVEDSFPEITGTFTFPQGAPGATQKFKTYAEALKAPPPAGCNFQRFRKPQSRRPTPVKSPSWVGHCITTGISRFNRKLKPPQKGFEQMVNVYLKLHQSSSDFPPVLLSKGLYVECTVEWLPKNTPHHRIEDAVLGLSIHACDFVRSLAIGEVLPDVLHSQASVVRVDVPNFEEPNADQCRATTAALCGRFTMIQGPPGTGKTKTGARIAYLLSSQKSAQKVLVCGPTNTSVDNVAENVLKIGDAKKLRIVRVYGEEIEQKQYPLPWTPKPPRRSKQQYSTDVKSNDRLASIALHHLIRLDSNPHSAQIKGLDYKFRYSPDSVAQGDILKFVKALTAAEVHELSKADIILCTCSTAGAPRLTQRFHRDFSDNRNLRRKEEERQYSHVVFSGQLKKMSIVQQQTLLTLAQLFYNVDSGADSSDGLHKLVNRRNLQVIDETEDENSFLNAVVDQLHQLHLITDSDQLRIRAVSYCEENRLVEDGVSLAEMIDEEWIEFIDDVNAGGSCNHVIVMAVAEILHRTLILYSGGHAEPFIITPNNVDTRLRPLHIGHLSGLQFATVRLKGAIPQDDIIPVTPAHEVIDNVDDSDDETVDDSDNIKLIFPRRPAGEAHNWNVIIDECAMCTEPDTLIPLVAFSPNINKVILIGDHKQLQPIITCREAEKAALNKSLFERFAEREDVSVLMLTEQYRMHKTICEFPSKQFYGNKLRCAVRSLPHQLAQSDLPEGVWPGGRQNPVVFCHVVGEEKTQVVMTDDASEQSKNNAKEAEHVVRILKVLANKHHVDKKQIVILTQYRSQQKEIAQLLEKENCHPFGPNNVSTVVLSQGREWDYVILSCVRSLPESEILKKPSRGWMRHNLGRVCDYNQLNVALTRARKGLIILGNKNLLQCDSVWRQLLDDYMKKSALIDVQKFL